MMRLTKLQEMTNLAEASTGGFFTEAKGYDTSGDFTDEFYDLFTQSTKMKKVMKNPKWMEYMKLTDMNMSTSTQNPAKRAIRAIVELEEALQEIDREFDRANGHADDADSIEEDDEFDSIMNREDR